MKEGTIHYTKKVIQIENLQFMSHVAIYILRQIKKNASEKFGYVKFEFFFI